MLGAGLGITHPTNFTAILPEEKEKRIKFAKELSRLNGNIKIVAP